MNTITKISPTPTPYKNTITNRINRVKRFIKNNDKAKYILQGIGVILLHIMVFAGYNHSTIHISSDTPTKFTTNAIYEGGRYITEYGQFGKFTFELDGKKYTNTPLPISNEFYKTGIKNKKYEITASYTQEVRNPLDPNFWDILVLMVTAIMVVILGLFDIMFIFFVLDCIGQTLTKWWEED